MLLFPNAKINLGLYIESKRADGYHNISTVFYPIGLKDVVEIVKSETTSITTFGNPVDCPPEKNLVMKAYRMLEQEFNLPPVKICLYKHIPDGAGLGGGSSDASATLRILNEIFALNLSDNALAERAVRIGADCPFFIYNRPLTARGIGDKFTEIDIDLTGYTLILIKPDVSVSTAEAYAGVKPSVPKIPVEKIVKLPVAEWKDKLINDFETSIFSRHGELSNLKSSLYEAGAVYAAMSGSGSAIYGLFSNDNMAEAYKERCQEKNIFKIKL